MRLIDADELINRIKENPFVSVTPALIQNIKDIPTAYDSDKVIRQIEDAIVPTANHRHNFCGTVSVEHCVQYEDCECCMAVAIIKIIKKGGKDDF